MRKSPGAVPRYGGVEWTSGGWLDETVKLGIGHGGAGLRPGKARNVIDA